MICHGKEGIGLFLLIFYRIPLGWAFVSRRELWRPWWVLLGPTHSCWLGCTVFYCCLSPSACSRCSVTQVWVVELIGMEIRHLHLLTSGFCVWLCFTSPRTDCQYIFILTYTTLTVFIFFILLHSLINIHILIYFPRVVFPVCTMLESACVTVSNIRYPTALHFQGHLCPGHH